MYRHRLLWIGFACALGVVGCGRDSANPADAGRADGPGLSDSSRTNAGPDAAAVVPDARPDDPAAVPDAVPDASPDKISPSGPEVGQRTDAATPGDLAASDAPPDTTDVDAAADRSRADAAAEVARADVVVLDAPPLETGAGPDGPETGCTGWTTLVRLSPADAKTLIDTSDPIVINVHIPYEGDIPGTDVDIPYNDVNAIEDYLGHDHCADVLLVCRSGGMSQSAGTELIRRGYLRVRDINGGMQAWQSAGYPLLLDGGT